MKEKQKMTEERGISPGAVIIPLGLGLGLVVALAAVARAAPPTPPPGLANLYGVVNDAVTGELLPNVLVSLNGVQAYTNSKGEYSITEIEPGYYSMKFEKGGYEVASADVTVVAGDNELNVSLTPIVEVLGRLLGVVTDAHTGAPLNGVRIELWSADETELLTDTTTNSSGHYSIENIYPSNYSVVFIKEGYETTTR